MFWKLSFQLFFIFSLCLMSQNIDAQALSLQWIFSADSASVFSSPKAIDLTRDNVKDIVFCAGIENKYSSYGIVALDGKTGTLLWKVPAHNQMYSTPIFQDINQDGVPDVFVSGRDAQFYALDGSSGDIIWRFWDHSNSSPKAQGWYNFYNPKWLPDLNQDGFQEILISNGGDATAFPNEKNRPAGYLMVIDGATGEIIAIDQMPDGKETYFSPIVFPRETGTLHILFGSGGETIGGKLYLTTLNDLLQNDISNAQILLEDTCKGFIAPPSLVDINNDNQLDIIVPAFNERLVALDGKTFETIWQHKLEGYENYTSPTIGNFTSEMTPDIFYIAAKGNWPFYFGCKMIMLDGKSGEVVWEQDNNIQQLSSPNAFDWDKDGLDEVFFLNNCNREYL